MTKVDVAQDVLVTSHLTKYYGDFPALVDVTMSVHAGEVYGFLGPNGAGKTTMIRTVMDEIRPTSGSAQLLGLDSHRDVLATRAHLGYLPADLALYPQLTGRDTLRFFGNLRGEFDDTYTDELAERFGAQLDKRVGEMSTGNRQKIGIIQAFMNRPSLLILDEPSAGLDPLMQRELQTLMRETVSTGASIFLSSHTLSEVQRAADRVGIIRQGRLIAQENVASLRAHALRQVELDLDAHVGVQIFQGLPGVTAVESDGVRVRLSYQGTMDELLAAVAPHASVIDISTREADLEEIFLAYYSDHDGA